MVLFIHWRGGAERGAGLMIPALASMAPADSYRNSFWFNRRLWPRRRLTWPSSATYGVATLPTAVRNSLAGSRVSLLCAFSPRARGGAERGAADPG